MANVARTDLELSLRSVRIEIQTDVTAYVVELERTADMALHGSLSVEAESRQVPSDSPFVVREPTGRRAIRLEASGALRVEHTTGPSMDPDRFIIQSDRWEDIWLVCPVTEPFCRWEWLLDQSSGRAVELAEIRQKALEHIREAHQRTIGGETE